MGIARNGMEYNGMGWKGMESRDGKVIQIN